MIEQFGQAQADFITKDLVLLELGDKTPEALLMAGESPRRIWLAICRAQGVPESLWQGLDKKAKN
jgi:hypothetical protein